MEWKTSHDLSRFIFVLFSNDKGGKVEMRPLSPVGPLPGEAALGALAGGHCPAVQTLLHTMATDVLLLGSLSEEDSRQ